MPFFAQVRLASFRSELWLPRYVRGSKGYPRCRHLVAILLSPCVFKVSHGICDFKGGVKVDASVMVPVTVPSPGLAFASFDASNMVIDRVILHQVHSRTPDKKIDPPKCADALLALPMAGKDALQKRLTAALGSKSHGVEMSIEKVDQESFFQVAADAIHATDAELVMASKKLAEMLTQAQLATNAPPGMLAVITGTVGASPKRFVAVVKADTHDGFGATENEAKVEVSYLDRLLLTPTQKLYKVALLLELSAQLRPADRKYKAGNYRAFLFDHLITATETRSAAVYFYSSFAGMDIQKSSKKLTQDFYEATCSFISITPMDDDDRTSLREALRTELRSASGTINADDFAKAHIRKEHRTAYKKHLEEQGFPNNAIVKDVAYVKSRLRRPKRYKFVAGIELKVPADADKSLVAVTQEEQRTVITIESDFEVTE